MPFLICSNKRSKTLLARWRKSFKKTQRRTVWSWLSQTRLQQMRVRAPLEKTRKDKAINKSRNWSRRVIVSCSQSSTKSLAQLVTTLNYSKTILASSRIYGFSYWTIWILKITVTTLCSNERITAFTSRKSSSSTTFRRLSKRPQSGLTHRTRASNWKGTLRRSKR